MRSDLRTLVFVAVVAAAASGIPGTPAHAGELLRYSGGASAVGESSGRGRYAGYFGRPFAYQPPTSSPVAVAGYGYYPPQPVYQVPAASPGAVTGYWYDSRQPVYQVPVSSPGVIVSYGYYDAVRR